MNYLFFDIECCDGKHMCSFGYVIVDEDFNLIKKEDIAMNPEYRFKLGRAGFDPKVDLAYTQEFFKKQPNFEYYYEIIKNILCAKDTVLLGHAVGSDLNFIKIACERYHVGVLNLKAYDTQDIYYQLNNEYKHRSLENIMNDLEIDFSKLTEHKSCDDAEMSMIATKEICKRLGMGINEVLELCESSIVVKNKKEKTNPVINKAIYEALKKKGLSFKDFSD